MRSLLKLAAVDGKSTEDSRNFPGALEVIKLIRNSSGKLKVWDFVTTVKDTFPKIRIAQV